MHSARKLSRVLGEEATGNPTICDPPCQNLGRSLVHGEGTKMNKRVKAWDGKRKKGLRYSWKLGKLRLQSTTGGRGGRKGAAKRIVRNDHHF